jgi:hypothetical protein
MDEELARTVRQRAGFACEYCRLPEEIHPGAFEIEHIVAKQHRGPTTSSNLAYSCLRCNRHKGPNLSGIDPLTTKLTPLFHPRRHRWDRHFRWDGPVLVGRTAVGRTTIAVLDINADLRTALRQELIDEGLILPGQSPPIS